MIINESILNRKGARKAVDIPTEVLNLLNFGQIETVNLTEWLAIDYQQLIKHNFNKIGISKEIEQEILDKIIQQKKPSTMNSVKLIGSILYQKYAHTEDYSSIFLKLSAHQSDSIRCFAPYLIALNDQTSIEEKFYQSKTLVADKHFGVREVIWIALRPEIEKNIHSSILYLSQWAKDKNENIRRFTTESTRPRGVWCKHIDLLKEQPEIALPILQLLQSDSSKYVQDSVGNWLNDASKSQPSFVLELCQQWQKDSPTKATAKIIKRARRTLDKK